MNGLIPSLFDQISKRTETLVPTIVAAISAACVAAGLQIETKTALAQNVAIGLAASGVIGTAICFVMYSLVFLKATGKDKAAEQIQHSTGVRARKLAETPFFIDVTERISKLEEKISSLNAANGINVDDVVRSVEKRVRDYQTHDLIDNATEALKNSLDKYAFVSSIREAYQVSVFRLEHEAAKSRKAGLYNLIIGGGVGSIGVAILAATLFMAQPVFGTSSIGELVLHYAPRLGLVLLVEGLALFFLRLYKASADDVRYYNNELTNIEQKSAAYEIASSTNDDTLLATVLEKTANVERNFILKKDETTIFIENARMNHAASPMETLKALAPFLSKVSGGR